MVNLDIIGFLGLTDLLDSNGFLGSRGLLGFTGFPGFMDFTGFLENPETQKNPLITKSGKLKILETKNTGNPKYRKPKVLDVGSHFLEVYSLPPLTRNTTCMAHVVHAASPMLNINMKIWH